MNFQFSKIFVLSCCSFSVVECLRSLACSCLKDVDLPFTLSAMKVRAFCCYFQELSVDCVSGWERRMNYAIPQGLENLPLVISTANLSKNSSPVFLSSLLGGSLPFERTIEQTTETIPPAPPPPPPKKKE